MKRILIYAILIAALFYLVCPVSEENAQIVDLSRTPFTERSFPVVGTQAEERCLVEAIYYEAGNQSEQGKEAVALVIMNRVRDPHRPNSICGIISQARRVDDRKVCQFSYSCMHKYRPNKVGWAESEKVAHRVLTSYWHRDIITQYDGAVYYHADYVRPKWRHTKEFLGKIDNHLFYAEKTK